MSDTDDPSDLPTGGQRLLLSGWRLVAIVVGASAILGVAHFLGPMSETAKRRPANAPPSGRPDLTIADAVITSYRESGELKYRLLSPQIEHFERGDETYLRTPDLSINREPDPPWRITAQRGVIYNASPRKTSEEVVSLEDDVHMVQSFADGRNFHLVTPSITIYPARQYAETTRDVMITTHAGRTRAVGLQGNLEKGLLKLFSNDEQRVHTVILPDQFK